MNNNQEFMDWDHEGLDDCIKQMKSINSSIAKIFSEVKQEIQGLQGEWIANTSEVVFQNFEKAYKIFDKMKAERQNDVQFAQNANDNYKSMEESINSIVDTHIDL